MSEQIIRTLFTYHVQRLRQIWDSINTLSEAQFFAPVPYSIGSLCNHMVHLIDDDASWMALLRGEARPPLLKPEMFATRTAVFERYSENETAVLTFIHNVDPSIMQKEFVWQPNALPTPQYLLGWQVLLHVVNHGTDHRSQILRLLHDFGAPTFDQDLMEHLVQTGQTAVSQQPQ